MSQTISAAEYDRFRQFLEKSSGIVLGDNKYYLVQSRLTRLLQAHKVTNISELIKRLESPRDNALRADVVDAMTTNETSWFRDSFPFELLKEEVWPDLAKAGRDRVRIWSAASSSGQEAYSISMAYQEYRQKNPGARPKEIEILGTDISTSIVKDARAGIYDTISMARGLSVERKTRFFEQHGDRWHVRAEVKQPVQFREHNLQTESTALLGKFDIIFCRNVLIYFSADAKRAILMRIARMLQPEGFLFLGASESMSNYSEAFTMVKCRQGVIYRLKPTGLAQHAVNR